MLVHDVGSASADTVGLLWEADPATWWNEVSVHMRGAILLAYVCLPSMVERSSGQMVLIYGLSAGDTGALWADQP